MPSTQNIYRMAARNDPFARIPHDLLNDTRLTWHAKGVLSYLCGKPAGWKMRITDICNHGKDGEHAIRSALKELRRFGYAQLVQLRNDQQKIVEWAWKISDSPIFDVPDGGFPLVEKLHVGNHHLSKNEGEKDGILKRKGKGALQAKRLCSFSPKYPYPRTEEEMYETLEARGVETMPDYDGNFFETMRKNGWIIPGTGKPVYDWITTYQARTAVTQPGHF